MVQEVYDITISHDTIWRRVRDAGLTYQKPERQYFQLDEKVREEWLRTEAPAIRKSVKKFDALLYFQDEANVSLTAFLGKTWAPRGHSPRQKVTGKRGGIAAMSAINGRGRLLSDDFPIARCRFIAGVYTSPANPGYMSFIYRSTRPTGILMRKCGII